MIFVLLFKPLWHEANKLLGTIKIGWETETFFLLAFESLLDIIYFK